MTIRLPNRREQQGHGRQKRLFAFLFAYSLDLIFSLGSVRE